MHKQLKFSYNWNNKLDCNYFTTLRLSEFTVGELYEVAAPKKEMFLAEVLAVKYIFIEHINDYIAGWTLANASLRLYVCILSGG